MSAIMNLWANLDNNTSSPETMRPGRTRRLTERSVLSSLREWLLQDYAAAYCRSLAATRIFRRCYWVDALGLDARASTALQPSSEIVTQLQEGAKKGRKKAPPPEVPLALQPINALSQRLAQESRPITLSGLLVEGGSSKRKDRKLAQDGLAKKDLVLPKESGILRGSWLEVAPTLLAEIETSPAIFLLNPFGPTLFTQADLTLLLQRSAPTELCLFLSHKQIETHLLTARRSPAQATILTGLLRTDRWKTLPLEEEERQQAVMGLLDLFTAALKRHFSLPVQNIALLAAKPAAVEQIPYTLVFATRRQDSLMCMNDAVCAYSRSVYEESRRGVLGEEWFASQLQERRAEELAQLYQRTLQQGRTQRIRRWPDLRLQLLLANFGTFFLSDYDTIIQRLLANGEVRCEWRQRSTESEEKLIPGAEDTLLWR